MMSHVVLVAMNGQLIVCNNMYIGVLLTQRHRWARKHNRWVSQVWNRVIFTDESKFNLNWVDGRVRVWRRRGKR